jgi:uncharacterized protein (TIGR03435 family)
MEGRMAAMTKRTMCLSSTIFLITAVLIVVCVPHGMVQTSAAQDAARPVIDLPPPVHSVRANHSAMAMIEVSQPEFPAQITVMNHGDKDWLESAQVKSRTQAEIVSAKLGWAYVLTGGPEFHAGEVFTPVGGVGGGGTFQVPAQSVAPRADAKGFLAFVEEVTFADGTVVDADHAKVTAFYATWSAGANASKVASAPTAAPVQQNIAGGTAGTAAARTPNLKPITFDVISFRKAEQQGRGREFPADGDFIAYHGSTVHNLLLFAYGGIKSGNGYFLISGEPEWVKTDYYEFQAKVAPEDVAVWKAMTLTDKRYMVQAALEDVLKLKVHDDSEEHPVYNLVVAKGGPKLMDYEPGDTVTPSYPGAQARTGKVLSWFDPFNLVCQDTTMAELVNSLSGPDRAGRVVIDKTGLTGVYDFTVPIPYRPLPEQFRQIAEDSGVPTMFEGLKQIGLQLASAKGPINGIVVDHIERPPEN